DTKSSSGTFVNGNKLTPMTPLELHAGDTIKLGEDCEVNGVFHQCVFMRLHIILHHEEAAQIAVAESQVDVFAPADVGYQYSDYSQDPQVRANVDAEFTAIWDSLTRGLENPLKKLRTQRQHGDLQGE
ncbi:hypothetical protein HK101_006395, partial [Irineochytrium annulatum]